MTARYLEDFAVGQVFKTGRLRVDKEQIFAFARQFDPQPFHLDEEAARQSPFQGLAASGWHTAALTMRLMVDGEFKPAGGILGVGFDELSWPRPVRPGDELHAKSEILEVRPSKSKPDRGMIRVRTTTFNQNDEAGDDLHRQSCWCRAGRRAHQSAAYEELRMRILVVGAGAIGGYFGGRLKEAGRDVTFPGAAAPRRATGEDRARHPQPVRRRRICRRRRPSRPRRCAKPFDLILLSCKAYDLASAGEFLCAGRRTEHRDPAAAQRHGAYGFPRRAVRRAAPCSAANA